MRPCGATRAGTQAPPLPTSIIFFHAILYKQNSVHVQSAPTAPTIPHTIYPNDTNRPTRNLPKRHQPFHTQSTQTTSTVPRAIYPNETVGAVPMCPPERPRNDVSIPKTPALCVGVNDGCAPAGRHGRAAAFPCQKHTHHARGLNDGCALAGRHGRAHRHRPYQPPPNHAVCPHRITLYIR